MKYAALIMVVGFALSSCDAPGRHEAEVRAIRPNEVANFRELFSHNCSGCHGKDGQGADRWNREGHLSCHRRRFGHPAHDRGGPAWNAYAGFRATRGRNANGCANRDSGPRNPQLGDAWRFRLRESAALRLLASGRYGARAREAFATACSSCHGQDGRGARAIADRSFLALVTGSSICGR